MVILIILALVGLTTVFGALYYVATVKHPKVGDFFVDTTEKVIDTVNKKKEEREQKKQEADYEVVEEESSVETVDE